jgi:hypothetical protein
MTPTKLMFTLALILGLSICWFGDINQFVGEWKATGHSFAKIQIRLSDNRLRLHALALATLRIAIGERWMRNPMHRTSAPVYMTQPKPFRGNL